jgi:hypothetical protein
MADNHIIIGLGGRGGNTLEAFRKIMYKNTLLSDKDPEKYPIGYIYIDSDQTDLNKRWNEDLGIDYGINKNFKINIKDGVDYSHILSNLSSYTSITPWIGDRDVWKQVNIESDKGANQIRKLGRVYFAASVSNQGPNSYPNVLQNAFSKVQDLSGDINSMTYHIIAGLSGGTGSGSVIDVIAQTSKYIQENARTKNDKIVLYLYLPEANPIVNGMNKDIGGRYFANPYAALKEINAMGLFDEQAGENQSPLYFQPIDIKEYSPNTPKKIKPKFHCCFLFSEENEESQTIEYNKELPKMVADFIYNCVIDFQTNPKAAEAFQKLTENISTSFEVDDFSGKKERSLKFASASIKRIEIPEIDIIDLYGSKMMLQLILQQKYNNWKDAVGYENELGIDQTVNFVEKDHSDNFIQLCELTLPHLSLQTPHGADDIKNAETDWDDKYNIVKANTLQIYKGDDNTIPNFKNLLDNYYNNQFRGIGVDKYWNEKTNGINQEVKYFYNKIEEHLFSLWVGKGNTVIGLNEIIQIIERLNGYLKEVSAYASSRIAHWEGQPNKFDSKNNDFTNLGCEIEIAKLLKEFRGFFNINKKGTFEEASFFVKKLYVNRTNIVAYKFAIKLNDLLITELDSLKDTVAKILDQVLLAETEINKLVSLKNDFFEKNKLIDSKHSSSVVMLYPNGSIEREFDIILNNKDVLQSQLQTFRKNIKLNSNLINFKDLINSFNSDLMRNELLFTMKKSVPKVYEILQQNNIIKPDDKLVGRHIFNYLQNSDDFKSKDKIKAFFEKIKSQTGVYAKFSLGDSQKINTLNQAEKNQPYGKSSTVIKYPYYRDANDPSLQKFEESVVDILKEVFDESLIIPDASGSENQITVFKSRKSLALRSFATLGGICYPKYRDIIKIKDQSVFYHTEKSADEFPKLAPFNDAEKESEYNKLFDEQLLGYYLLGYAMDFVQKNNNIYYLYPNPADLTQQYTISKKDAYFYEIKNDLFAVDTDINSDSDIRPSNILQNVINDLWFDMRPKEKSEKKELWLNKIRSEFVPYLFEKEFDNDKTDKEYHKVLKAVEFINEKILITQ